ncbi:MAG: DUF2730 family protein [Mesorhizobium sp.]
MPENPVQWVSFLLSAIALAGIVYGWFTAGEKQVAKDLAAHKQKHGEDMNAIDGAIALHDRRIQSLETEFQHLPNKDSLVELKLALSDLKGTVGRLDESLGSVQRTVLRIDDWLRADRK